MTCSFPGCYLRGIVVAVGPDMPTVLEPESIDDMFTDGPQTYVDALACPDHVEIVKRRLREQHQPRRMAMREGRP